jgi:putative transposase
MVAALASRELGRPVNRKRVQRIMRAHRLLQPSRSGDRRRRPGFFRVTRPDALWHLDMTKVWTAQHGWVYLHAIIDCCTRELVGWSLELRCRDDEAIACVEAAVLARNIQPGQLTLGTDNGSQFTSRDFRRHLSARGITHRRGGYRDPESQAFIESWFGQFKKRLAWRSQWESLDQARREVTGYVDTYHHRPHSGLAYRTPAEVAATGGPTPTSYKPKRPDPPTTTGSTSVAVARVRPGRSMTRIVSRTEEVGRAPVRHDPDRAEDDPERPPSHGQH